MTWRYRLRHAMSNRYAMTAVLFLAVMVWGALTALFGTLSLHSACQGYAPPLSTSAPVKTDPALPVRALSAPAASLEGGSSPQGWTARLRTATAAAETTVTKALEEDRSLIQLYGAFQALTARTVVEDPADPQYSVARLADGSLTFVGSGLPDAQAQAAELARLNAALAQRDTALLYVQAPSKLEPGNTRLPYGLSDPSNGCADRLLAELDALGVDTLDLRQTLAQTGEDWSRWFYRTDHHWNQDGAFLAYQAIAQRLEDYDQSLRVGGGEKRRPITLDPRVADPETYAVSTLRGFFLGSQGKRVGSTYAGTDDFQLWTPRIPTLLHYNASGSGVDRYGSLSETVLFSQRVETKDLFDSTPYTYYAGGDYPIAQITNYYNPQGPRVLLIRDSYACAVTPYLALASSRLTTLDPRTFSGDLLKCVDSVKPDVVIVLYSSGMVRSQDSYRLLSQPAAPSKADALRWQLGGEK